MNIPNFITRKKKRKEKSGGHIIKCLLTELDRAVRHDLGPNIFPSGPPTQSIRTYYTTKSLITILAFRLIELSYKLVDHTGLQIGVLSVVADFCVEVLNAKIINEPIRFQFLKKLWSPIEVDSETAGFFCRSQVTGHCFTNTESIPNTVKS